ncbi:MAG TPA: hypothetical protein VK641_04830, partial [Terriglobales bacterium]|nr:hypothetical protein [Terriglobales bacterium]
YWKQKSSALLPLFKPYQRPKLSDGGGWRDGCMVGGKAAVEAASVTAGAVRCSALILPSKPWLIFDIIWGDGRGVYRALPA